MAKGALFVGWGALITGREKVAQDVSILESGCVLHVETFLKSS